MLGLSVVQWAKLIVGAWALTVVIIVMAILAFFTAFWILSLIAPAIQAVLF